MPNCKQRSSVPNGTLGAMRTGKLYLLIAAIAIAIATVALAGLIVTLIPQDPDTAAASMQRQVLEPKIEAIAESHRRGNQIP